MTPMMTHSMIGFPLLQAPPLRDAVKAERATAVQEAIGSLPQDLREP